MTDDAPTPLFDRGIAGGLAKNRLAPGPLLPGTSFHWGTVS
ncbi:hypothetical protein [Microbacterium sp. 18062]|nr:hypothetical protein [Microbacterium sp. 18062]